MTMRRRRGFIEGTDANVRSTKSRKEGSSKREGHLPRQGKSLMEKSFK